MFTRELCTSLYYFETPTGKAGLKTTQHEHVTHFSSGCDVVRLQVATGRNLDAFLAERITQPLGMVPAMLQIRAAALVALQWPR